MSDKRTSFLQGFFFLGGAEGHDRWLPHLTELRSRLLRIILIWVIFRRYCSISPNDLYTFISETLAPPSCPKATSMIAKPMSPRPS